MTSLGPCAACHVARARVTFDGFDLCAGCIEDVAQEELSSPDVDDGTIAFVAMSLARLNATYPLRNHITTIGCPGITAETWERFGLSLSFHGLTCVLDEVDGWAEVFDVEATSGAAGIIFERAVCS